MNDEIDFSKKKQEDKVKVSSVEFEVDKVLEAKKKEEKKTVQSVEKDEEFSQVQMAHLIKNNPPDKGYMETKVEPSIYCIDLNVDAHWWFNDVCTVFPLLLDQGKRTHIDLKDSFKEEKRLPDFNYMFIVVLFIGLIGIVAITKMFGWW